MYFQTNKSRQFIIRQDEIIKGIFKSKCYQREVCDYKKQEKNVNI